MPRKRTSRSHRKARPEEHPLPPQPAPALPPEALRAIPDPIPQDMPNPPRHKRIRYARRKTPPMLTGPARGADLLTEQLAEFAVLLARSALRKGRRVKPRLL